jgi:hypothetical protein
MNRKVELIIFRESEVSITLVVYTDRKGSFPKWCHFPDFSLISTGDLSCSRHMALASQEGPRFRSREEKAMGQSSRPLCGQ